MSAPSHARLVLVLAIAALLSPPRSARALAQGLEDDGGSFLAPRTAAAAAGAARACLKRPAPIGLGRIGDIEFAPGMPNRGALITAGNPPTIPAGVWEFNGVSWHELSTVCGASDGRIDLGRLRKNSGRSPTGAPARRRTPPAAAADARQHALPLLQPGPQRRTTARDGIVRVARLRSGLLPGDERRRVPFARATAGSPANRCRRKASRPGRFTCTGMATR